MQRLTPLLLLALAALLAACGAAQQGAPAIQTVQAVAPTVQAAAQQAAPTIQAAAKQLAPTAQAAATSVAQVAPTVQAAAGTAVAGAAKVGPTVQAAATTVAQVAPTVQAAAGAAAKAASGPLPQAAAGTGLRKVQDRGKLIVGVKYDVPTFGYLNPQTNKLEGFDVDLAKGIAKYIFGDDTKIEFVQAVSANRIPFLQNDTVDIIASTMTANEDRAKQIDFTRTYYVAGQGLLVPANSTITGIKDLDGKTVCSAQGSTSEKNIREKAPKANVILFQTYAECVQTMDAGRADAVTTDDNILLGFVKQSPGKYKVPDERFTTEPYGMGVKQGNKELLDAANAALDTMIADGTWAKLYAANLPGVKVPAPPPADWRLVK